MVDNLELVWDKEALGHFKDIYNFHKKADNLTYANEVKNAILIATQDLLKNPFIFEQDRFKFDNDSSFRAFEKFKYRVAYKITDKQIRILRVRHTSREPIEY
jgi:plasmid stabilization system protein ParE